MIEQDRWPPTADTSKDAIEVLIQDSTTKELQLISDIAKQLLKSSHPVELIEQLCQRVADELQFDVYLHRTYEPREQLLVLTGSRGLSPTLATRFEKVSMNDAACGEVAKHGSAIFIEHLQSNDGGLLSEPLLDKLRDLGLEACCCLPLIAGKQLLGTVLFGMRRGKMFTRASAAAAHPRRPDRPQCAAGGK